MWEKVAIGVGIAGLVLATVSCGGRQSTTAAKQPSSARAAESWTSPRFGYKWVLPPEWEFYPMEEIGLGQKKLVIDVVGARRKDKTVRSALLYVWDYTIREPTEPWGSDPSDYEDLERFGVG